MASARRAAARSALYAAWMPPSASSRGSCAALPEPCPDLYILSDHGQVLTRLFTDVSGGHTIEHVVRKALRGEPIMTTDGPPVKRRPSAEDGWRRQWTGVRAHGPRAGTAPLRQLS
jgi:hypothetical protein